MKSLEEYAKSEAAYYERQRGYEAKKALHQEWRDNAIQDIEDRGLWDLYIKYIHSEKLTKSEEKLLPELLAICDKAKAVMPEYPSDPNLFIFPLSPWAIFEKELTLEEAEEVYRIAGIDNPSWLRDMLEGERLVKQLEKPDEHTFIEVELLRHGGDWLDSKTRSIVALNAGDLWWELYGDKEEIQAAA